MTWRYSPSLVSWASWRGTRRSCLWDALCCLTPSEPSTASSLSVSLCMILINAVSVHFTTSRTLYLSQSKLSLAILGHQSHSQPSVRPVVHGAWCCSVDVQDCSSMSEPTTLCWITPTCRSSMKTFCHQDPTPTESLYVFHYSCVYWCVGVCVCDSVSVSYICHSYSVHTERSRPVPMHGE